MSVRVNVMTTTPSWLEPVVRTRTIPTIAFTGDARPEVRSRSLELGFAAFIAKPTSPQVILSEVERLIGPARKPAP